jgi:hypothetical protein
MATGSQVEAVWLGRAAYKPNVSEFLKLNNYWLDELFT